MKKDEAGLLPEEPKNLIEQRTSKKVKFLGTQSFINAATGEIVEMSVTDIEERDFNFVAVAYAGGAEIPYFEKAQYFNIIFFEKGKKEIRDICF